MLGPWTEGWIVTYVDPVIPANTVVLQAIPALSAVNTVTPVVGPPGGVTFFVEWATSLPPGATIHPAHLRPTRRRVCAPSRSALHRKSRSLAKAWICRRHRYRTDLSIAVMTIRNLKIQHNEHRARGFTLVEVLVSLVILSIGLLGIAKLMLFSSHSNDSAYLRSQATDLAYEILDYMRANIVQAGRIGRLNLHITLRQRCRRSTPGSPAIGAGSGCVHHNLAALYDLYQWGLRLEREQRPCTGRRTAERSGVGGGRHRYHRRRPR